MSSAAVQWYVDAAPLESVVASIFCTVSPRLLRRLPAA